MKTEDFQLPHELVRGNHTRFALNVVEDAPSFGAAGAGGHGVANVPCLARILHLEEGLYALIVGPIAARQQPAAGISLPATAVSAGPSDEHDPVDIALSSGDLPGWIDHGGGTVIARVPLGGGIVVMTSYGVSDEAALPRLQVLSLNGHGVAADATPSAGRAASSTGVDLEVSVHIEREGDQQMPANGWVGVPGQRRRIEAFGIRPLDQIAPADIEYMAFGPAGRQTPWVTDAKLCGTRGRSLPLTGFAVRLTPALRDRFDIVYEGSFFASGVTSPHKNGDPCVGRVPDDPLEAIRLRVIKRSDG